RLYSLLTKLLLINWLGLLIIEISDIGYSLNIIVGSNYSLDNLRPLYIFDTKLVVTNICITWFFIFCEESIYKISQTITKFSFFDICVELHRVTDHTYSTIHAGPFKDEF